MKVQATKAMTSELNKYFKQNGIPYAAQYETMTPAAFGWNVDIYTEQHEADILPASGKMRAIKILYPAEDYALPRYITTRELVRIFRKSNKTLAGFMGNLCDEIAI